MASPTPPVGALLTRGMLVGVLAGLLVFAVARVFGEPSVVQAIGLEAALDDARGMPAEPELVSRAVQAGIGLLTGVMTYSVAFGGLFALAYAAVAGRIGRMDERATSAVLALAGFVAIYLVPNLKYPANPPSIGAPDTIGHRTALYFLMLAASVAASVAAAVLFRRLARRMAGWDAALVALAAYGVAMALAAWLLPAVDEVPAEFPATLLWRFRVASFGMQAVLWATIGVAFGAWSVRSARPGLRRVAG